MWKSGYGDQKGLTLSYVIMQICAAFGSTIYPYALAVKSMAEQAVTDGRQDNILAASEMIRSWGWIILLAGVAVAAVAGAMIGRAVVKKHISAVTSERHS